MDATQSGMHVNTPAYKDGLHCPWGRQRDNTQLVWAPFVSWVFSVGGTVLTASLI